MRPGDFHQGVVTGNYDERQRSRQDLTMTIHWEENLETESEEIQYGRHTLTKVSPQNMPRGLARGAEGKPAGAVDGEGKERTYHNKEQVINCASMESQPDQCEQTPGEQRSGVGYCVL